VFALGDFGLKHWRRCLHATQIRVDAHFLLLLYQ
jgi:hypothetical protein